MAVEVTVARFICRLCRKTTSRPWGFLVPYCVYTAQVIESVVQAYLLEVTSYRRVALEMAKTDLGDRLPPSHVQMFNWVKQIANRAVRTAYKVQKELGLKGAFDTVESMPPRRCPNAHRAHSERKAARLNVAAATVSIVNQMSTTTADTARLHTYFLREVENHEAILSGRTVVVGTPHSNEQIKRVLHLDSQSASVSRRKESATAEPFEMGTVQVFSDSSADSCQRGANRTPQYDEGDSVTPSFDTGWG